MKRFHSRVRLTRAGRRAVACTAAGTLVLALLVFFLLYKVNNVEVVGNTRYEDKKIQEYVMQKPIVSNSMLAVWFSSRIEAEGIPFVESFELEKLDNHTLRIHVNEKKIVGYVVRGTQRMYFDKDGRVVETLPLEESGSEGSVTQEETQPEGTEAQQEVENKGNENATQFHAAVTDVPKVVGLGAEKAVLGEKIKVEEKSVFNTILGITRMVEKYQILPETVYFNEESEITLVYHDGKVHCRLGPDKLLEEKITRVAAILPMLKEESGILHLEDYTTDITNIIFSKEPADMLEGIIAEAEEKETLS